MTTAHRPTWKAAVGKAQEGGYNINGVGGTPSAQRSILDAPAHTKLKTRKNQHDLTSSTSTQGNSTARDAILKKSLLKLKLMEEKKKKRSLSNGYGYGGGHVIGLRKIDEKVEEEGRKRLLLSNNDVDEVKLKNMYDDGDDDGDADPAANGNDIKKDGWSDVEDIINEESDLDASDTDSGTDSEDESDDDDDDEEDLLQAELAKIRAEREKAKAKVDAAAAAEEQNRMEEAALIGNPLLNISASDGSGNATSGKLKRRWNDDVVFRNQAKGEPDQNKKRFINDTVRNDFHKRFLNKFIR
jgi:protein CWC15